jgi:hypothetical protein
VEKHQSWGCRRSYFLVLIGLTLITNDDDLQMLILSIQKPCRSKLWLRQAHHVFAWAFHFHGHTHPPTRFDMLLALYNTPCTTVYPTEYERLTCQYAPRIAYPLKSPVGSWADTVFYHWNFASPPSSPDGNPTPSSLHCQTLFAKSRDSSSYRHELWSSAHTT